MTKPADGQIAKARERVTVAEFRKQWSHKPTPIPLNATGLWYSEECTEQLMAEFAASERQAVIEECAKAVCMLCRHEYRLIETESGGYSHINSYCIAEAIWDLHHR